MNEVFALVLCTAMTIGLLILPITAIWNWNELRTYFVDMTFAMINGILGVGGVTSYVLGIPLLPPATADPLISPVLFWYVTLNILRYACWYSEFLVSFMILTCQLQHRVLFTLLRYAFHTLNLLFSVISFALTIDVDFPSQSFVGHRFMPPIMWQSLIVHYVFGSYALIMSSRLYRFNSGSFLYAITFPCCGHRHPDVS